MGDVGGPSADQLAGGSAEQACLVINSLAKFHAPHFDRVREAAKTDAAAWVVQLDDDDVDVNALLGQTLEKGIPSTISEMKDPKKWNVELPEEAEQFLLGMKENFRSLQGAGEPPLEVNPATGLHTTIIHGDPRLDNFFFDPCMLIDFQLTREACPETDVAYFLCGGSITTEVRRAHELCLIRLYHEQLCELLPAEQGVSAAPVRRYVRAQAGNGAHSVLRCRSSQRWTPAVSAHWRCSGRCSSGGSAHAWTGAGRR